ncbi:chaplin [Streptomyces sp. NPDC088560]|uniref:chaplin n=1 Tax=Streptomyces sp. NPDC088560 TaxID=3365868 RepID=UPI0038174929
MKRVTRNGAIALAVASGAMAVAGPAHADSTADGSTNDSPGLISGNTIQLPVHVPVNICGNTIDVVGFLNPAAGNSCTNQEHSTRTGTPSRATASGRTQDSPGVLSGNGLQLPVQLPLNVSGNTVDVAGIANPVFGNTSANSPSSQPSEPTRTTPEPPARTTPPARPVPPTPAVPHEPHTAHLTPHTITQKQTEDSLAQTGADGIWTAAAASITALIGGGTLYRRFRPPTTR